jgi:predicted RNA polymerase sigma factor
VKGGGICTWHQQESNYHLEASIAYWHTIKEDTVTKWENILHLFNQLLALEYSPVAALNRTYALAKVRGNEAAIAAAEQLQLNDNPFYFALLGELYRDVDTVLSRRNFTLALGLAKTDADRQQLNRKLSMLV